jgi:hypothetical protein
VSSLPRGRAGVLAVLAWLFILASILAGSAGHDRPAGAAASAGGVLLVATAASLPDAPRGIRALTGGIGLFFVAAGIAIVATA